MSNPFVQLRSNAETLLAAAIPDLKVKGAYNGEKWDAIAAMVARDGSCLWTRLHSVEGKPDGAPKCADFSNVQLQLVIGAAAVAGRALAAEHAEELAWTAYETLRQTKGGSDWLLEVWHLIAMSYEDQTPSCAVISVILRNRFHAAIWTEASA